MKLIRGDRLTEAQRADVLRRFVHRNTGTFRRHDQAETPLYQTDAEWLAAHAFYIRADGALSNKHGHCEPYYMANNE